VVVVLIHGIFMSGREMSFLRRQLAVAGFSTRQFLYPSVRVSPAVAARLLGDFVADIGAPVVHYWSCGISFTAMGTARRAAVRAAS
jgi:hypothetical protein